MSVMAMLHCAAHNLQKTIAVNNAASIMYKQVASAGFCRHELALLKQVLCSIHVQTKLHSRQTVLVGVIDDMVSCV